jgi:signal transduction histidine kinase
MGSFCKECGERQRVEIDFQCHDLPSHVPLEISLCLIRVLQEALHNSVKHSGVRHHEVRLRGTPGQIDLAVSDLGVGFDKDTAKQSPGLGLISMEERLKLVKGTLSIEAQPRGGTTIRACVPLIMESASIRAAG